MDAQIEELISSDIHEESLKSRVTLVGFNGTASSWVVTVMRVAPDWFRPQNVLASCQDISWEGSEELDTQ